MRIIISIIVIAVVIGVYMRFRKTLQRRIDNAISQTVFKQLTFLVMATGVAFGTIMLFI